MATACLLIAQLLGAQQVDGYAPWQDRASTLIRQVGLGSVLDRVETIRYLFNWPGDAPPDVARLRASLPTADAVRPGYGALPPLKAAVGGAGWLPVAGSPGRAPVLWTGYVQPDARHGGLVVGVALLRSRMVRVHLVAGTAEPGLGEGTGSIPPTAAPALVAAFNSGFKASGRPGGFYLDGHERVPLVAGKAAAVIDDTGRLAVGQWGRGVSMTSHVRAVRQNLDLIVDAAQPVPGLATDFDERWGSPGNQRQYTWRSGLGITAAGDVVYAAGDKLTLQSLATALVDAGAVTGMELDIHSGRQSFAAWTRAADEQPSPHLLMATMAGPAARYTVPDARDFFYVTLA